MKKFLSILLALALVLSLGTVAFATGGEPGTTYKDHDKVTLTKNYILGSEKGTSPAETFTFSGLTCESVENAGLDNDGNPVTPESAPVPRIEGGASFEKGAAGTNQEETITIDLPDNYEAVGVYTYTFNEVDNNTAGVTYRTNPITLVVYVIQGDGKLIRYPVLHTENSGGQKSDSFDNTYSAGSLAVEKVVTGNMGDQKKEFDVTVTFMAPTGDTVKSDITYMDGEEPKTISAGDGWTEKAETISLHHGETIIFENIPYGVGYTVEERVYDDYEVTYDGKTGTIGDETPDATTITNNKDGGVIDTGVFMDSLPYVLLLVGACAGLVVFFARRRMTHKG